MYRTLPHSGPSCDAHPAAPAHATCSSCSARICVPCSLYDGLLTVCPTCAKRTRRSVRARFLGTRAVLAVAIGGAYLLGAYAIKERREHPMLWGEATPAVRALIAEHEQAPCDAPRLERLTAKMSGAGDVFGALDYLDRSRERGCALPDSLDVRSFELHRRAHDSAEAVRDLDRRVARDPHNPVLYTDRAYAKLAASEPQAAVADFVASLGFPSANRRRTLSDLGQVYTSLGRSGVARALAHASTYALVACTTELEEPLIARARLLSELAQALPPELTSLSTPAFVDSMCDERTASAAGVSTD